MADEQGPPQRLLVADSEVLVRHAIAHYLRNCGYDVIEAASFEEAILILGEDALVPHAVLSDIELSGGGNGFALRAWVREHCPQVEVVLAANIESAAKAASELCDEGPHLSRPYEPQAVADHVRRLLAARDRSGG